jgi:hypothetical protein
VNSVSLLIAETCQKAHHLFPGGFVVVVASATARVLMESSGPGVGMLFLKPRVLHYLRLAMGSSFWVEAVSNNDRSTAQLQNATYIGYIFSVCLNLISMTEID